MDGMLVVVSCGDPTLLFKYAAGFVKENISCEYFADERNRVES